MNNVLRMGSRMINGTSPVLLAATGAMLALTLPPVRRTIRSAAVLATKGVLIASDEIKEMTGRLRENAESIVQEARETGEIQCPSEAIHSMRTSAKAKGRKMAVAATASLLAMKERAKASQQNLRSIVDEAKDLRSTRAEAADTPEESEMEETPLALKADSDEESPVKPDTTASEDIVRDAARRRRVTPPKNL